jgi:hypothetical protein
LEFHNDNSSEFTNNATKIWCSKENLPFTRSRDHRKNGNCFVGQKNGAVVREYLGYDRLEGFEEQALLAAVYTTRAPLLNYILPSQKLKHTTRIGSREIRAYDEPRSPFQRLIECPELPQACKGPQGSMCPLQPRRASFSRMSTRLSCLYVSGSLRQTALRPRNGNSFGSILK